MRAFSTLPATRSLPGVGTVLTPNQREVRGLRDGERADMTCFVPPLNVFGGTAVVDSLAMVGVTKRDVRSGHTGAPGLWNDYEEGKEPSVLRLKGEPALQRLLDGLGQSAVDDPKNVQHARGIKSEGGVHIEGVDRQILRIRRLAYAIDETPKCLQGFRAAVQALANDLPELWKTANGIAGDPDDRHSPVIQQIAESIANQLNALREQLSALDVSTASCEQLAKVFDDFSWRRTSSYSDERFSTSLTFRTSPFLHETAYLLIDFLKIHGRIIRADEEGHGAVFEFALPEEALKAQNERELLAALENSFWTEKSHYTRAEFDAVLRLLGWGMMADQAQTVEVVRDKAGKALKDRSGLIFLTRSKPLPAVIFRLDFSAGVGLPEVREPAKPAQ